MRTRLAVILAAAAIIGWAVAIYAVFASYSRDRSSSGWSHGVEQEAPHEHATEEGPPVIKLSDLPSIGFDSATIARIEPNFHVLNAALVTLVELHEKYKSAADPAARNAQASSVIFHQTADRHEQKIESLLAEDLRTGFHAYMLRKEAEVGLHPDSAWHVHGSPESRNPLPLYRHPERK